MFLTLPVVGEIGRLPEWKAGQVLRRADLVVVVSGPLLENILPRVESPEVFAREGAAWIHRFVVRELLAGDVDEGTDIVAIQPPGRIIHRSANIAFGESLLFLRRMRDADVELIRESMPWGGDKLPDDVWTFVEPEFQWMNWIQLKTIRPDGEIDERPRSILAAQLKRHAGVEQDRESILTYVQELSALHRAVLDEAEVPDEEGLDRFQRSVMQAAKQELLESREE